MKNWIFDPWRRQNGKVHFSGLTALCFLCSMQPSWSQTASKKEMRALKAEMAAPLRLPSDKSNPYDPNAESWPIKPPVKSSGQASQKNIPGANNGGSFIYKPGRAGKFVLTGGVEENVPRTPEDVAKYLRRMKMIVNQYDRVATATLMGATAANTDPQSLKAAREQTQQFITQIRATIPPSDLKEAHGRLAITLADVSSLIDGSGSGLADMGRGFALISEVHNTMDGYHDGVRKCIAFYGLPSSLDPFSDENESEKAKFAGQTEQYQAERTEQLQRPTASSGSGLGNLFGSGGGMGDIGQLLKMMPGLLGGGNENSGSLFNDESGR